MRHTRERLMRRLGASIAVALVSGASLVAGQGPSKEDVTRAVAELVARLALKPPVPVVVRGVDGCYPGAGDHSRKFICLVDVNGQDGKFEVQPMVFAGGPKAWTLEPPNPSVSPACPTKAQAEPLFRAAMGDATRVVDTDDEGTFTDERGKFRDKHGPMRLMCSYEVARSLGTVTVVAYFTYRDGKYGLDTDYETWW